MGCGSSSVRNTNFSLRSNRYQSITQDDIDNFHYCVFPLSPREVENMIKRDVPVGKTRPKKKIKTSKKPELKTGVLQMSRDRVRQWKRGDFLSSVPRRPTPSSGTKPSWKITYLLPRRLMWSKSCILILYWFPLIWHCGESTHKSQTHKWKSQNPIFSEIS